jgi:NADH-quinone oxidoreductase subunit N
MWMRPGPVAAASALAPEGGLAPIAGGSPEADIEGWPTSSQSAARPEVVFVAVLFAAASVFFGIFPSPLFNLAAHAGHALSGLF